MTPQHYFSASFYAMRAGIYFNRVLMVSSLAQQPDAGISALRDRWFAELRETGRFYVDMIKQATAVYQQQGSLAPLTMPKFPDDYFTWAATFLQTFRTTLTVGTQSELLFSYGYCLGNAYCDLEVLRWALELQEIGGGLGFDQDKQINTLLADLSETQFRWAAGAILLGKDEKTHYLWQAWRYVDDLLKQLIDRHKQNAADPSRGADYYRKLAQFVEPLSIQIAEESKKVFEHLHTLSQ